MLLLLLFFRMKIQTVMLISFAVQVYLLVSNLSMFA
uniref:Uncharacterized protein n=1 Tax=Arundo donax TaxID=35708 RepID=A0A0A9BIC9_ARUDO